MSARIITCSACQRHRPHKARGWCSACWVRWDRAGRPDSGPPAPTIEPRHRAACTACGEDREHAAHGWCYRCYYRWYRAGQPDTGPPQMPGRRSDTTIVCASCRQQRTHRAHGWCEACYARWCRAGRPDSGPPAPKYINPSAEECAYRISEFAFLLSCGQDRDRAAQQLGISTITARKYERALQKEAV